MRISSESAESWHDISARGLVQYRNCPGDQLVNWKNRGYSTILDILIVCTYMYTLFIIYIF